MKILRSTDFLSGAILLAIGIAALIIGQGYRIGTASQMGPGYFPVILAIGLIGIGIILIFQAWGAREPEEVEPGKFRAVFFPILAVVVFGLVLDSLGLVISLVLLLLISVIGSDQTRWKEVPFLIVGAVTFALLVFVYGVGLQVKVLPA